MKLENRTVVVTGGGSGIGAGLCRGFAAEGAHVAVTDVNLKAAFNLTKIVSRGMVKRRSGAIINVASVVGLMGNAGQANYAAAKAGVIGFTKAVAKELASRTIRVNAVAPGFIDTQMTADLAGDARERLNTVESLALAEKLPFYAISAMKKQNDYIL